MTEANPFVAMLPLKIVGGHYAENLDRLRILLDSFERFLDLPAPLQLFLVCLPAELPIVKAALRRKLARVRLEFIAEDDIISGIGAHRAIGWYKQQALKLAFCEHAPQPFYLTLDPDILLCRTLQSRHLVHEGRCYTSWMSKAEHPQWWEASARLLGCPLMPASLGLNVTPNMLSASIGRRLGEALRVRLETQHPWRRLLDEDAKWTEYTLYSMFAETAGLLDIHHHRALPEGRRLLGRSVWTPANFENYRLTDIHDDRHGAFFTVCASHTGVTAAMVRKLYADLVERIAVPAI